MLSLSPAAIRQAVGMPPSTYRDQFVKLIDKGYLIRRGNSNTFDFYETPKRVTHTEMNITADGYDFTTDDFRTTQSVKNETAENIEINIDNINMINNCGGEKQVSPLPLNEFDF
jgi:hypothetical protein